ncbi:hypothetical protein [Clostridium sp. ATCC 25772]|uniref:hypothetical protein n=1 Tax=Clostridium sp. ATCC 25772 TaxID=1676991 RepID=UPI0007855BB4|nr:hypothetical protein [Clostridium sp. ATCC 25772]
MKKSIKILIVIISLFFSLAALYYFGFYPNTTLKSMDSTIEFNEKDFVDKFLPKDFKLNLSELSLKSHTTLNEEELTDLCILAAKKDSNLNNYLDGLKIEIDGDSLILNANVKYNKIPFRTKFVFKPYAENNTILLKYQKGSIGFIPVSSEKIFSAIEDTDFIQVDKANDNIILNFSAIKYLDIKDLSVADNSITIDFEATLKFWDLIKK